MGETRRVRYRSRRRLSRATPPVDGDRQGLDPDGLHEKGIRPKDRDHQGNPDHDQAQREDDRPDWCPQDHGPEVDSPQVDDSQVDDSQVDHPQVDHPQSCAAQVDAPQVDGAQVDDPQGCASEVDGP